MDDRYPDHHAGRRLGPLHVRCYTAGEDQKAGEKGTFVTLFSLTGKVIRGNQLGRKLGYPTANIDTGNDPATLTDKTGIYAATVDVAGTTWPGVASMGFRPTLAKSSFSIEVHIFGFSEDIYDQTITIHFHARLRDEKKFSSLEELTSQMNRDAAEARLLLGTLFQTDPDPD